MNKNKFKFLEKKKTPEPTIEMLTKEHMCRTKGEKEYRDFEKNEARPLPSHRCVVGLRKP